MYDPERPYSQRDVMNMLTERLPAGKYTWIRDPEGNPSVQAYGASFLPSQPVYVQYRPSVVKMQLRFTPRRISPSREEELWQAAEAARGALRQAGVSARRQPGRTQETERDEQWVLTIPERLSEAGYDALGDWVALAAGCMGIEAARE
ncbi:MAG: hypothetical protein ACK47B_11570 [Armatimonadota bacterium]